MKTSYSVSLDSICTEFFPSTCFKHFNVNGEAICLLSLISSEWQWCEIESLDITSNLWGFSVKCFKF